MKKLSLDLDRLAVETFEPGPRTTERGTVHGESIMTLQIQSCYNCTGATCVTCGAVTCGVTCQFTCYNTCGQHTCEC